MSAGVQRVTETRKACVCEWQAGIAEKDQIWQYVSGPDMVCGVNASARRSTQVPQAPGVERRECGRCNVCGKVTQNQWTRVGTWSAEWSVKGQSLTSTLMMTSNLACASVHRQKWWKVWNVIFLRCAIPTWTCLREVVMQEAQFLLDSPTKTTSQGHMFSPHMAGGGGGGGGGGFDVCFNECAYVRTPSLLHLITGAIRPPTLPLWAGPPPATVLMTGHKKTKVGPVPVHRAPTAHPP